MSLRDRLIERRRTEQGLPPAERVAAPEPTPKVRKRRAPRVLITQPTNATDSPKAIANRVPKEPKKRAIGSNSQPCRAEGCDGLAFGQRRYCDACRKGQTKRTWYAGKKQSEKLYRTERRGSVNCSECGSHIPAEARFNDKVVTCSPECRKARRHRLKMDWQSRKRGD